MTVDEGRRGDIEFGTIPRLVRIAAERFGAACAIADDGVHLSFGELGAAVQRMTRALIAAGVERGDRVAIWAPNTWEWIVAALATHSAGAALVPINTRFKGDEAAYVLAKSRARVLFTVTGFLGTDYVTLLRRAEVRVPSLERVVVLRGDAPDGTTSHDSFLEGGDRVAEDEANARALSVDPSDLSDLLFTSGTTGNPKGVMCSHAQTLRAFRDWADVVGLRSADRYLVVLPFFHSFGYKAGWLASLMMGATVVPEAVFDVDAVLARVASDKITVLPGPPALYQTILAHPDLSRFDLSSLRLAVTGAATIPVELIVRMRERLTFRTIVTGYGLTEASGVSTMCRATDDAETIATTSGRAIPGVDVRIVDEAGSEVARGEIGEVVVRGYTVMRGYYDDPGETAAAIDDRGFLHTGDIGVMDARGNLRVTDRKKDMFIVGGFNAYPAEIENVLLKHDAVLQVAVVGVPDARLGEVGRAFVVLRPNAAASEEELSLFCKDRMANYKVPRRFSIVSALPVNATGKVQKFLLREIARSRGEE